MADAAKERKLAIRRSLLLVAVVGAVAALAAVLAALAGQFIRPAAADGRAVIGARAKLQRLELCRWADSRKEPD